jgi:hypothetical protein
MSSGSSAWGELEKQYFPQTDVGRQTALIALNNSKLNTDGDPEEYYQNLRLSAAAYDAMRTDGGKHCEDDFKRIVMANLPEQYKIIGNTMKHTGATTAGIIAAIRDVRADTQSTPTTIRHDRTAGVPGAMTAMATHAEISQTRKCTYEFCTRPNSKHTIEQCWDRRAALERFQTVTQSNQQQYFYHHDGAKQQYSNYGTSPLQQQYAPRHGSSVQQQYAPHSQHDVYQPNYLGDLSSYDARQQQWVQPTSVQAQPVQPAAHHAYTSYPYGAVAYGGVAYATAPSSIDVGQSGVHVPLHFPVRNEQARARDNYHGRAQEIAAIASYASNTDVQLHQRPDHEAHVGGISISTELCDSIGDNNSGISSNHESAGEEMNVGVDVGNDYDPCIDGIVTGATTGETMTTTDYDDCTDDNVTTTVDGLTTADDGFARVTTTGDSVTTTDEIITVDNITATTIGVIGTTITNELTTTDDDNATSIDESVTITDEVITTTDDNSTTTGDKYSDRELPIITTTTGDSVTTADGIGKPTTDTILTDLSPITGNYSDCAIHHLTKSRHHAYPELSLVRYDTVMVKLSPIPETTLTLSDDVAPPDGRIQSQSDDITTDALSVSTTANITSDAAQCVSELVNFYQLLVFGICTTKPIRAPNIAEQYDGFFTKASEFGGVTKVPSNTIDRPQFNLAVDSMQTCANAARMTSGIGFGGLISSLHAQQCMLLNMIDLLQYD